MLYYQEKWKEYKMEHAAYCPCFDCVANLKGYVKKNIQTEYKTFTDAVTEIDGILKRSGLNDETVLALYKTRQALMLLKAKF